MTWCKRCQASLTPLAVGDGYVRCISCCGLLGPEPEAATEHLWHRIRLRGQIMTFCRQCGVVKRRQGRNDPCRGYVGVSFQGRPLADR